MSHALSHGLGWQDEFAAELVRCDKTRIVDGPILHCDGDILPENYPGQRCPICRQQLRLVWIVRAEVRVVIPSATAREEPT